MCNEALVGAVVPLIINEPDKLIPPLPTMFLEFKSRLPPSCGVVSSTTFEMPLPPPPPVPNPLAAADDDTAVSKLSPLTIR